MQVFTKQQLNTISAALWCSPKDIRICGDMKKGMTNSSVLIIVDNKKYIIRLPGAGSNELIDRAQECQVYNFLHKIDYDKHTVFISQDGLKISKYIPNARNADKNKLVDSIGCMKKLREFHELELMPDVKYFSLLGNINKYDGLVKGDMSTIRKGYKDVYDKCVQISNWIDTLPRKCCLCQIDANPDNAIFSRYSTEPTLIDWEYAGLQDPHIDIAMWALYCNYNETKFNQLIREYFQDNFNDYIRYKIYGYAALGGLLWYNWCIYKKQHGVDYGDYTEHQFEYAEKYADIVLNYINCSK